MRLNFKLQYPIEGLGRHDTLCFSEEESPLPSMVMLTSSVVMCVAFREIEIVGDLRTFRRGPPKEEAARDFESLPQLFSASYNHGRYHGVSLSW